MQKYIPVVVTKWCKQCGICAELCPKGVFRQEEGAFPQVVKPEDCTGCRLCGMRCPDFAIELEEAANG